MTTKCLSPRPSTISKPGRTWPATASGSSGAASEDDVARAAAFEPRLKAVVAWGANYDYHAVWQRRITVGGSIAAPVFQLMYITGTDAMDAAMERIKDFKLEPVAHQISCPFLIVHGREDQQIPVADANRMFDAVGSKDKTLKIFAGENGGAAHCQFDNHLPGLLYVADWLARKL